MRNPHRDLFNALFELSGDERFSERLAIFSVYECPPLEEIQPVLSDVEGMSAGDREVKFRQLSACSATDKDSWDEAYPHLSTEAAARASAGVLKQEYKESVNINVSELLTEAFDALPPVSQSPIIWQASRSAGRWLAQNASSL